MHNVVTAKKLELIHSILVDSINGMVPSPSHDLSERSLGTDGAEDGSHPEPSTRDAVGSSVQTGVTVIFDCLSVRVPPGLNTTGLTSYLLCPCVF